MLFGVPDVITDMTRNFGMVRRLREALRKLFFTKTVTRLSCCRNSSTTLPVLLDQEGEDVIELNMC